MRIIHPGSTFIFECEMCECKFEVGTNDPTLRRTPAISSTGEKEYIYCDCPACGYSVCVEAEVVVMDGGFTRYESQEKKGDES